MVVKAVVPDGWARLQIEHDPPIALVAMDMALGPVRDEFDAEWKKLGPEPWMSNHAEARRQLQSNGPFQRAFLPIARLLREKCSAQISGASLIARVAKDEACQDALTIDPFLKALLGPQAGQNVTVPERAARDRAALPKTTRGAPAQSEAGAPPGPGVESGAAR
jgi:hypothetical protein